MAKIDIFEYIFDWGICIDFSFKLDLALRLVNLRHFPNSIEPGKQTNFSLLEWGSAEVMNILYKIN